MENLDYIHQLGSVYDVKSYLQVSKDNKPLRWFKLTNLSVLKQEKRSKKFRQIRIYVEYVVELKKRNLTWHDHDYYNFWRPCGSNRWDLLGLEVESD